MAVYEYGFILAIVIGIFAVELLAVNIDSEICGYNGDSLICCDGYKKDDQGECRIPICDNDCGVGGHCIRPNTCYCADGRVSYSCPDEYNNFENNKIPRPSGCSDNCNGQGDCVKGICKCRLGYTGVACLEKPIGQCYLSLSRGICQKTENAIKVDMELCCAAFGVAWGDPCKRCARSRCETGYIEVDGRCQDVNECRIPGLCHNGRCENVQGSYRCLCVPGFKFVPGKGECVKMQDTCMQEPSVCGTGMKCVPTPIGIYSCQCLQGYTKSVDNKSCVVKLQNSFNFCDMYGKYVCQFGKCQPQGNNYKCDCIAGYKPSGDHKSCKKNIDYCAIYENSLCQNGLCVSINDDYMCKCDPGYTLSFDGKKCTSVCDLFALSLCPNAKCVPLTDGNYECRCNDGYSATGKGKQCRRIMNDQSASSSSSSSNATLNSDNAKASHDVIDYCSYNYYKTQCQGGRCINRKNYYQCECLPGYVSEKSGLACKKIDDQSQDQMLDMAQTAELHNYCDKYGSLVCSNGRCIESGSSYQCRCNLGYKESKDVKSCTDIDECAGDPNICIQGTCTNSPGNYQCSCHDGFTIHYVPGGPKCYDRNECEENHMLCRDGQCHNKWGSYSCSCNAGYVASADERECLPARYPPGSKDSWHENECKNCAGSCKPVNATSYTCQCQTGLSSVLNTGLCAPMTHVVDIQIALPRANEGRPMKPARNVKHIFLQVVPGTDKNLILTQITSQFRTVVLDQCQPVNESERNGIQCSFYSKPQGAIRP